MQLVTRAIIYTRVSTDAQESAGSSLQTQERACFERAESEGWTVVDTLSDASSGYSLEREGFARVRNALRNRDVDVVIAYAVDRLSRNQNHVGVILDEVESAGARLEIVTERFEDTAIGRFILGARAFMAEVEREKIAERTSRGKGERARSGRMPQATGRGIFGYVYDRNTGKRVVVEAQAAIVRRIFDEFVARRSCNAISERLNAEGAPAFGGGRWYALTIRRILLNRTYTGVTTYRETRAVSIYDAKAGKKVRRVVDRDAADHIVVPEATPAIISVDLHDRARTILADPARRSRLDRASTFALRGRIVCAECGAAMTGHAMRAGGRAYRYYRCTRGSSGPGETRCASRYVRADDLEREVRDRLARLLSSPARVVAEVKRASASTAQTARTATLRKQLNEVNTQRARLADLYLSGAFDQAGLDTRARALDGRGRALGAQLRELADADATDSSRLIEHLPEAAKAIAAWVREAAGDDIDLLLRGVDVTVRASTSRVTISGFVPLAVDDANAPLTRGAPGGRARFEVPRRAKPDKK